jgi:hypothetical protein
VRTPGTAWASGVAAAQMFVSAITIHQLKHGVLLAERGDPSRGTILRRWLDISVGPAFARRVLRVDEAVARRSARLHVPERIVAATPLSARAD